MVAVFQSLWGSILPCSRAAALAVALPKCLMRTGACIRQLSLSVSLLTLLFSPKVAASFVSLIARWIVTELGDVLQVSPVRLLCKRRGSAHRQFSCLLSEGVGGGPSTVCGSRPPVTLCGSETLRNTAVGTRLEECMKRGLSDAARLSESVRRVRTALF